MNFYAEKKRDPILQKSAPGWLAPALVLLAATLNLRAVEAAQLWRHATNETVNVVYTYSRIHGTSVTYDSLRSHQSKRPAGNASSAKTLVNLSEYAETPLQAVKLSWSELLSCPKPVIVHMDTINTQEGAYLLLLSATDNSVNYMHGALATMHQIDYENFRRGWSQIAFLPAPPISERPIIQAAAGLLGGVFSFAAFFFFCKSNPKPTVQNESI